MEKQTKFILFVLIIVQLVLLTDMIFEKDKSEFNTNYINIYNYENKSVNIKSCFDGCEFGFTRGSLNIISVDGFDRQSCKAFCGVE